GYNTEVGSSHGRGDGTTVHGAGQREWRQYRPGGKRRLWGAHRRPPRPAATGGAPDRPWAVVGRGAGWPAPPHPHRPLEGPYPGAPAPAPRPPLLPPRAPPEPGNLLAGVRRPARSGPGPRLRAGPGTAAGHRSDLLAPAHQPRQRCDLCLSPPGP